MLLKLRNSNRHDIILLFKYKIRVVLKTTRIYYKKNLYNAYRKPTVTAAKATKTMIKAYKHKIINDTIPMNL